MPLLSVEQIKTLIENRQKPCISMYMPMQKAGRDIRQNPIRFKNHLRQAEERLTEMGIRRAEAEQLLQPVQELDQGDFWEYQDHGLAIFISPAMFDYYRLPLEFTELVVASDRFHLKPLLPLFTDERFYVLALSQQEVRLMECTQYTVTEVELEHLPVPESIADILQYNDTEKQLQFRTGVAPGGGTQAAAFHGQGDYSHETKANIRQYFHQIDDGLHEKLRKDQAPLVLAGVDYLLPIYREANTYQYLVETGITGNPEILKPEELQAQAWQIVEPLFQQIRQQPRERYQELAGSETGKTSNDLKEIVPAAYYQRVDSLFIATDQQHWGQFNPETMDLQLHPEPEPEDEDMLDFAAIQTLINGGNVHMVEPEQMPDVTTVAAIFRY